MNLNRVRALHLGCHILERCQEEGSVIKRNEIRSTELHFCLDIILVLAAWLTNVNA